MNDDNGKATAGTSRWVSVKRFFATNTFGRRYAILCVGWLLLLILFTFGWYGSNLGPLLMVGGIGILVFLTIFWASEVPLSWVVIRNGLKKFVKAISESWEPTEVVRLTRTEETLLFGFLGAGRTADTDVLALKQIFADHLQGGETVMDVVRSLEEKGLVEVSGPHTRVYFTVARPSPKLP